MKYACAAHSLRVLQSKGVCEGHTSLFFVAAKTEAEATGLAYIAAQRRYPVDSGWSGPKVTVMSADESFTIDPRTMPALELPE